MKFSINRDTLLPPLQQIVSVIEKKQTMQILSNILMVIEADTLTMTGTDLEIQIVSRLSVNGAQPGTTTLPARKFLDICRLLPPNTEIRIEQQGDMVKLATPRSRFSLSCLPAENYPEFAESQMENCFTISSGKLKKALDKTLFCMANQDVRYYLNGLLLHISNNALKLVASDGHRLAIYEDELETPTGLEARIIVPRKGVQELSRLLDDGDELLQVSFSSNHIRIEVHNAVFSAKLVDSKYPDFSKVFQQSFLDPIAIPKPLLREALTRVAILANEKFRGVTFHFAADLLRINAHNPEHEEAEEELTLDYGKGEFSISFNAQYMLDAVSNLDGDTAELTIASNLSSCFINEPGQQVYKFIVMPMRL
ncbi:DNA polymerase III subunit beta [Candidatus Methylomicrobium oryzae]|jgi:DNA polymerase-3 subunit beta|uniref:DNA polymerase III subunit beta n=1 Tax=Candidatus Methylomicrobium oryzae TaxID=2802053 RepID=UPI0019204F52|nr:DNA polymerase III subunit beta [Methylomicrobium sp. RS1]MBL1262471.1 DNA polymerase III subunit beta [Methylomicrobium sp. RS1]